MASQSQRTETSEPRPTPGVLPKAVEHASGGVVAVIDGTAHIAEEVLHAAGRVGNTALDEIFGLIGTAVGGISETATAMFQGRRVPRRDAPDAAPVRDAS